MNSTLKCYTPDVMDDPKKIVAASCAAEITEKRSRFIAVCQGISSEEEAAALIAAQRKKHYDARHVCFAYVLGENNEICRFSDDGEPQGTAGKPILDIMTAFRLKNALITVTRYFGGTLLGTGGLVRAYSQAAKDAVEAGLSAGAILDTERGARLSVRLGYSDLGRFENLCRTLRCRVETREFTQDVLFTLLIREEDIARFTKEAADLTGGSCVITSGPVCDLIFNPFPEDQ